MGVSFVWIENTEDPPNASKSQPTDCSLLGESDEQTVSHCDHTEKVAVGGILEEEASVCSGDLVKAVDSTAQYWMDVGLEDTILDDVISPGRKCDTIEEEANVQAENLECGTYVEPKENEGRDACSGNSKSNGRIGMSTTSGTASATPTATSSPTNWRV